MSGVELDSELDCFLAEVDGLKPTDDGSQETIPVEQVLLGSTTDDTWQLCVFCVVF